MTEHVVGASPLPLPEGVKAGAVFAGYAAAYRYSLNWHMADLLAPAEQPAVMFLLMNPSVASYDCADRTVLKCWRFTRAWGYSRMLIGNSAAYRATDQKRLAEVPDPVGKDNPWWLRRMASQADLIVVAHGKPHVAAARQFGPNAVRLLAEAGHTLHVLRLLKDGTPEHPLYIPEREFSRPREPILWAPMHP